MRRNVQRRRGVKEDMKTFGLCPDDAQVWNR